MRLISATSLIIVLLLILDGCERRAGGTRIPSQPITANGASFTGPKDWIQLKPDKPKHKGWFISPDSTQKNQYAMIMIDIGQPKYPDVETVASGLAKNWGARVLEDQTDLDGVLALRIRGENATSQVQPIEGVVAIHEGSVYMIMGGAVAGRSVADEVEEVRKHWRWTNTGVEPRSANDSSSGSR
jgi:hypothetical protein